ncbi:hypothetical protein BOX15_Mlig034472g2 [Macrostomum lignano]|uniref:Uncharacterized protein n=1 Tax=Macrostomum lignano TaxID=282301 RepID=A0A267EGG4_9PLAT|nr:hypothetical protein BOX15_Mlig034472g2 [Macrostomum lignano]
MQSVKLPTISRSQVRPVWLPEGADQLTEFQPQMSSIFRQDFVRHSLPKMPDLRPKISAYVSNLPFAATSEQRAAFQGDQQPRRRVRVRRGQLALSTEAFNNSSIYSQEFVAKERGVTENYKPKTDASLSQEPFQASSVYKLDYPRHETNPSMSETVAKLQQSQAARPQQYQSADPKLRCLDGTTDYGGNFLDPQVAARRLIPPGYKPPTEKMSGDTSYSKVFVPFAGAQPAPMFKPQTVAFASGAPFVGQSVYKDDFVPKPLRKSSANVLENRTGIMTMARQEEPGMPGVPIESFPENISGVLYRT